MKGFMCFCALIAMVLGSFGMATSPDEKAKKKIKISSSVDLKFWGRVIMNTHYDTDDVRGNTDFATYIVGEGNEELNFNPRDTRFGFAASSTAGSWKAGLVTEIDFYGDNAGNNLIPRLRLGYVKLTGADGLSFRLGQDWIPIGQSNPATVDFGILSWGGNLWWRVPQLTVRKKSGNVEWLGSLMKHRISSSQENQEDMPWAIGRFAWSDSGRMVALGLGYRSVEVSDVDYSPFMAVLELKSPLGSRASITSELWTGSGVGREFVRYGLDYNTTAGEEIQGQGGFVSLSFKTSDRSSVNLGVGLDDPDDDDALAGDHAGAPFLENQVMFLNYKGKLGKQFSYGLEVMDFDTTQRSGESFSGNRFTLSFAYVF